MLGDGFQYYFGHGLVLFGTLDPFFITEIPLPIQENQNHSRNITFVNQRISNLGFLKTKSGAS